MKELIKRFEKETGLEFYITNLDKGEDLYNYDFVNWLIKQLTTHSVSKSFYCQTERCDKQCDECGLVELNNMQ